MSYIAPLKDMLFDIEHLAARMPARRSVRAACNSAILWLGRLIITRVEGSRPGSRVTGLHHCR